MIMFPRLSKIISWVKQPILAWKYNFAWSTFVCVGIHYHNMPLLVNYIFFQLFINISLAEWALFPIFLELQAVIRVLISISAFKKQMTYQVYLSPLSLVWGRHQGFMGMCASKVHFCAGKLCDTFSSKQIKVQSHSGAWWEVPR